MQQELSTLTHSKLRLLQSMPFVMLPWRDFTCTEFKREIECNLFNFQYGESKAEYIDRFKKFARLGTSHNMGLHEVLGFGRELFETVYILNQKKRLID